MIGRRSLFVLAACLGSSALASPHKAESPVKRVEKVFLLQGKMEPVKVLLLKDVKDGAEKVMRMPDLVGHGDKEEKISQLPPHDMPSDASAMSTGSSAKNHLAVQPTQYNPIKFSKANIKGTLRLPRVRFARVGVPLDIRDESPSLDFVSKSLKESDF